MAAPTLLTVEDTDTQRIGYLPASAWRVSSYGTNYSNGTEHATTTAGASASFAFTGSVVAYYSDFNGDHADYIVNVDGQYNATGSSYNTTYSSMQRLFAHNVIPGSHVIEILNPAGGKALGVDYFTYQPLLDNLLPNPEDITVQGDDSRVVYSPPNAWSALATGSNQSGIYHLAYALGAWVSFSFEGSYIAYMSDKNSDHGSFGVSIDGGDILRFSSYSPVYDGIQLLFSQNLNLGPHSLRITNLEDSKAVGTRCFVYRPSGASSSESSAPSAIPASTASSHPGNIIIPTQDRIPAATIAGIGLGSAGAVVVFLLISFYMNGRQRFRRGPQKEAISAGLHRSDTDAQRRRRWSDADSQD